MAPEFKFTRATKVKAKARIALVGPTGSGKTFTALRIAKGLGKRIAVVDTEHGTAAKYAHLFEFDHLALVEFQPRALVEALAIADRDGYDVVIVDSLTHFWSGTGGMLEQVDHAAKRTSGGNSFGGWKTARPMERQMIDAMLASSCHVIVTMRTKTEWVIEQNERGKAVPRKIGTKPEQREGIDYEFDVVGEIDHEHTLVVTKSRADNLTDQVVPKPGEDFGQAVRTWLEEGADPDVTVAQLVDRACDKNADQPALRDLYAEVKQRGWLSAPVTDDEGNPTTLGELVTAKGMALTPEASV